MKKMTLLVTLFLGTLLAAQAQSVKIDVQKSTKKDMKVTSHGGYYSSYTEKQGTEGIAYTITIANHSTGTLSNLTVTWAVLVRSGFHSTYSHDMSKDPALRAATGTRNLNLGMGQHETFDTDPVRLNVTKYDDGYGYHSRSGDQIDGYVVKVMLGEKVLAVDCQPQDAMERLDNIKPTTTHGKR